MIRHAKTSGIPNPADATLVGGADWDDDHEIVAPLLVQGADDASVDVLTVRHGTVRATRTANGGANAVLVFSAVADGVAGNAVTVLLDRIIAPNQPLTVQVVGSVVTVFSATDGSSDPISTASQIKAGIEASGPASALVTVAHGAGSNGSGIHDLLGAGPLEGGMAAADALVVSPSGVTSVGAIESTPGAVTYGFRLIVTQALDDNGIRFALSKNGIDEFVLDSGGADMTAGTGAGQVVVRFLETDTSAHATIGSRVWDLIADGGSIPVFHVSPDGGILLGVSTQPIGTGFEFGNDQMQIKFDSTAGAPKLQLAAYDSIGNLFTRNIILAAIQTYAASNVSTDRTYNAAATTVGELADVLGTLIADLRAQGIVA